MYEYDGFYPEVIEFELEAGDSYEDIAREFDTSFDALSLYNPGINFEQVNPGDQLRIPMPTRFCSRGRIYIVRRGDTLRSIAREFNVSEESIRRANPLLSIFGLRPGLPLCIPTSIPIRCPNGIIYTIEPGDTLFWIASRYRTTVDVILRANPGLDPNRLVVGEQICIPTVEVPPNCPGGILYTVVLGDSLFSIALRYNTTVDAILRANPGLDPNRLFVGQRICIPVSAVPTCPGGEFYTVRAGDTLFSIANRFNIRVEDIIRANPGLDPNRLFIGQQLCIPSPVIQCPGGFFYTIMAGDTLFSIANRYNTTVQAILQVNPGLDPNRLYIGERICIPR